MAASVEDRKFILKKFSAVLKSCRETVGRKQAGVAGKAGLHSTYISELERARKDPGLQTLLKLGQGLSISAAELVSRTEQALKPSRSENRTASDAEAQILLGTDICPECKARYAVFAQRVKKRERGRFKCRRCQTQLASWLATTRFVYVTEPPAPRARSAR
jgi:transcriptional regulator with XRE-family HTH domain